MFRIHYVFCYERMLLGNKNQRGKKVDNMSQTAVKAACYRAYHSVCDQPKIFDDFLALPLIGEDEYILFKAQNIEGLKLAAPDFAASFPNDEALLAFMM